MWSKQRRFFLTSLILVLLAGVTACNGYTMPTGKPDQVQISQILPNLTPVHVTLRVPSLAQQLYTTLFALPPEPPPRVCPANLGLVYRLTFQKAGKTLVTAVADEGGCESVSISVDPQKRELGQAFRSLLELSIYQATPPATPDWLGIVHDMGAGQLAQTAQVASTQTVQQVYNALLALPPVSLNQVLGCPPSQNFAYRFVFHAASLLLPVLVGDGACNMITLNGAYQSRGGSYTMNAPFKQLLAQTLASAVFTPARPDSLWLQKTYSIKTGGTQRLVTDEHLVQQLYSQIVVPAPRTGLICPLIDNNVGVFYTLKFTQWSLFILHVEVSGGTCVLLTVGLNATTYTVGWGGKTFWDLLHQMAGD